MRLVGCLRMIAGGIMDLIRFGKYILGIAMAIYVIPSWSDSYHDYNNLKLFLLSLSCITIKKNCE